MLGKLLKYEFKATGRTLLPVYAALLAMSLLMKLMVIDNRSGNFWLSDSLLGIVQGVISVAYAVVLSVALVVTVLLLIQRFYKNLLRDEGYLMHTLPVAPWQNTMAKLIPAVLWSFVSIIMAWFSMLIIGFNITDWTEFLNDIAALIQELTFEFGGQWLLMAVEAVVLLLVSMALSIQQAYLAMAMGHLAHKNRVLWSVVAYIVINMAIYFVSSLCVHLLNASGIFDYLHGFFINHHILLVHCSVNAVSLANLLVWAAMFCGTNYILKNRLNLE